MVKVIICGAGIGGLTAAHELAKKGFDVTVYESKDIVGGMARSTYYVNKRTKKKYPVEYSWRVYGSGYKNLLRILHEIPLHKKGSRSVFGNLVKIRRYVFPRFGKEEVILSLGIPAVKLGRNIPISDKLKMLDKVLYCVTMSTQRMDAMDNIKWKDFCKDAGPEAKKYMVQMWGPVLGMDTTRMSFPVIARMAGVLLAGYAGFKTSLYLMDKPTNQAWFDEWIDYLQSTKNVTVKPRCEVVSIAMKNGKVRSVKIRDRAKNKMFADTADYYVCGLPVEVIAGLVSKNKVLSRTPGLKHLPALAKCGRQIQLSVQLFLDKKLRYPVKEKCVLYLPDTPWSLIIEPEDEIWGKTHCTDKKVKTVLSVGVCQTDVPGILHKKPVVSCTPKEIEEEVWTQMNKSYHYSHIITEDGKPFDTAKVVLFYIWDSFHFKKSGVWTSEPKFSNNVRSLRYQPEPRTKIQNFLFATGYTKTSRFIFSMESAAEAGTVCANEIIQKHNTEHETSLPVTPIHPYPLSIMPLRPLIYLDALLFKLGLPHVKKITFNNSIVLVCLYFGVIVAVIVFIMIYLFGLV